MSVEELIEALRRVALAGDDLVVEDSDGWVYSVAGVYRDETIGAVTIVVDFLG